MGIEITEEGSIATTSNAIFNSYSMSKSQIPSNTRIYGNYVKTAAYILPTNFTIG